MRIDGTNSLDQSAYLNANQALNRISTGLQINQASDDASGLAIAQNLEVQASGISQAISNVNSGVASTQIADSAISEQSNILNDVKEKLLQASTDTTSQDGREALLKDIQGLLENFDNIASSTNYNGDTLLQESATSNDPSSSRQIQAGESSKDIIESNPIQSNTQGVNLSALVSQDASSFTTNAARNYLESVDDAITSLNDFRAELGSTQNQLESSSRNLLTQYTQTKDSSSIILDVDYAKEVSSFSKQNVLAQIGAFASAQSNNINQNIVNRLLT